MEFSDAEYRENVHENIIEFKNKLDIEYRKTSVDMNNIPKKQADALLGNIENTIDEVQSDSRDIVFLDTEVHDLKSPILIQLAYKDSDTGEITSRYYSTG